MIVGRQLETVVALLIRWAALSTRIRMKGILLIR